MVAASEGVSALHVNKAHKGPAITAQSHKHHKLRQGEPSSVDDDTEIPILIHFRACVDIRNVIVGQIEEERAHDKKEYCSKEAEYRIGPGTHDIFTSQVLAGGLVSWGYNSELLVSCEWIFHIMLFTIKSKIITSNK